MGSPTGIKEARKELSKIVKGDKNLLSELMDDVKWLESVIVEKKKKGGRFMEGVSLSSQKAKVEQVIQAAKMVLSVAYKVKKSVACKEKRLWGEMAWMHDSDKLHADQLWEEKKAKRQKKEAEKNSTED